MSEFSPQKPYVHGVAGAQDAYAILMDLGNRGFSQASPLAAAILELNLSCAYVQSGQGSEALSKLAFVPKNLHEADGILKLPEFSDAGTRLLRTFEYLRTAANEENCASSRYAREAENELSHAISLTVRGADTILLTGYGPTSLGHIEEARGEGVSKAAAILRMRSHYKEAPYLAQALDLLFDAVKSREQGKNDFTLPSVLASGILLADAERHFIDRSMRAYFDHPHLDFRRIRADLNEVRDALSKGDFRQARISILAAAKKCELL